MSQKVKQKQAAHKLIIQNNLLGFYHFHHSFFHLLTDDNESYTDTTSSKTEESFKLEVDVRDDKYVKHLRTTLAGIPPPPKFTIPQYSAAEMSDLYKKNSAEFLDFLSYEEKTDDKAINDEMTALQFPDSMKCLYYGIQ